MDCQCETLKKLFLTSRKNRGTVKATEKQQQSPSIGWIPKKKLSKEKYMC